MTVSCNRYAISYKWRECQRGGLAALFESNVIFGSSKASKSRRTQKNDVMYPRVDVADTSGVPPRVRPMV